MEAIDVRGTRMEKKTSFLCYPDNKVKIGDAFVLSLGTEEPMGGPFLDAIVEGTSLVKRQDMSMRSGPERIGGQTMLPSGRIVLKRFEAVAPGESIIRLSEKQYRTDQPRQTGNVRVLVQSEAETEPVKKSEASGHVMSSVRVPDFFTCFIPEGWQITRNPNADRKIYGISAYKISQAETGGAGLKLTLEFYPQQNEAGYPTADQYAAAMLNETARASKGPRNPASDVEIAGRKAKRFERTIYLKRKTLFFFTRNVELIEEFAVVSGAGGFYVLRSSSPRETIEEAHALFQAMIDTFEPLR
jgi:hypothetical protein